MSVKNILLLCIILLSESAWGQDKAQKFNTDIDYPVYNPVGRKIQYGMIRNGDKLISQSDANLNCVVAEYVEITTSKQCFRSADDLIWSYLDNKFFLSSIKFDHIYHGPFIQDSTNVMDLTDYNHVVILSPIGQYIYSFSEAVLKGDYRYYPSNSIGYKLKKTINLDIDVESSDSILVYFRDKDSFSIFKIPIEFNPPEWTLLDAFASTDYDKEYPPHKYSEMFASEKAYAEAIEDNLFFEGDFKVISQANNRFVFNLQNGRIYAITENKIIHIGNIILTSTDSITDNQWLMIEDKDNNEILLNLPVSWKDTQLLRPGIRTIK